ncbi:MAG: hypothetical protein R6V04_09670 [bacterium]
MKVDIYKKNITIDQVTRSHLDQKVMNMEKRLKRYHPDACFLIIRLSKNEKKSLFLCSLELKIFNKILYAKKQHSILLSAIKQSFDALVRSLEKYRLRINKSLRRKKKNHQVNIKTRLASSMESIEDSEWQMLFHDTIKKQLNRLYRLARHEIVNLQLQGKREPGELLPQDVLDESILMVYRTGKKNKTSSEIEHHLIQAIYEVTEVLSREIDEKRKKEISIDKQIRQLKEEDMVTSLGEEMLYFYEPDEVLKLEDMVKDQGSLRFQDIPEEKEIQKRLYQIINRFPGEHRKVFTLLFIEDYSEEEVALLLKKSPTEIKTIKNQALDQLAEILQFDKIDLNWQELLDVFRQLRISEIEPWLEEKYENYL